MRIANAPEVGDPEMQALQQARLLALGMRTMTLPLGRGALTLGTLPPPLLWGPPPHLSAGVCQYLEGSMLMLFVLPYTCMCICSSLCKTVIGDSSTTGSRQNRVMSHNMYRSIYVF